jgi:hypothetical protein
MVKEWHGTASQAGKLTDGPTLAAYALAQASGLPGS